MLAFFERFFRKDPDSWLVHKTVECCDLANDYGWSTLVGSFIHDACTREPVNHYLEYETVISRVVAEASTRGVCVDPKDLRSIISAFSCDLAAIQKNVASFCFRSERAYLESTNGQSDYHI